jgi:hypothetical protein
MTFLILTTVAADSHKVGINTEDISSFERAPNVDPNDWRADAKVTITMRNGTRIDVKESVQAVIQALGAVVP